MMRLNGLGPPPYAPHKNGNLSPLSPTPFLNIPPPPSMTSTPNLTAAVTPMMLSPLIIPQTIPETTASPSPNGSISTVGSISQDGILGILSNNSATSTPASTMTLRRKPPPKPPRMRNMFDSTGSFDGTLSPTPSIRSCRGLPGQSMKSSLAAEVTSTLNASFYDGGHTSQMSNRSAKQQMRDKVFEILMQTKEFLLQEVNPEYLLCYLRDQGVISEGSFKELKKKPRHAMCDMLLDIVLSKGHEEFLIFCESLRIANQIHLADLLKVLDGLIETVTDKDICGEPSNSSHTSLLNVNKQANISTSSCEICSQSGSGIEEDIMYDSPNFDVDISYYDTEDCSSRSAPETAELKHQRKSSLSGLVTGSKPEDMFVPMVSVNLYNQCLKDGGIEKLAAILGKYSCVQELSLAKNHIDIEGISALGKALEKNHGLMKLGITLNVIGDKGASHLAQGLRSNTSLRCLNVTSTGLTGPGCNALVQGLSKNQYLTELNVGFNDLRDKGTEAISEILSNNSSLKRLRMRDNNISSAGCSSIFKALRKNSRLSVLDVSSNKIGQESLVPLGEMMLFNRTLREINLENCSIEKNGCIALARALKTNNILKIIDLSINPLCNDGAEALSDGLKYNQGLEVLCLNQCNIGNHGFLTLLEALRFNSTMNILKLCYNKIGHCDLNTSKNTTDLNDAKSERSSASIDDVYEKLCRTLQLNQDLKVLLWGNKLDDSESEPIYMNTEQGLLTPNIEPDYMNLPVARKLSTPLPTICDTGSTDTLTNDNQQAAESVHVTDYQRVIVENVPNVPRYPDYENISNFETMSDMDESVWNEPLNNNNPVVPNGKPTISADWPLSSVVDKLNTQSLSYTNGFHTDSKSNHSSDMNTSQQNTKVETMV